MILSFLFNNRFQNYKNLTINLKPALAMLYFSIFMFINIFNGLILKEIIYKYYIFMI